MERTHRSRITLLVALVSTLALGVTYKLADIQILHAERYRNRAVAQHGEDERQLARRGTIFDRRGRELAVTVRNHALYANTRWIGDVGDVARRVSPIVGVPASTLRRRIERTDRRHYRVAHSLSSEETRRLRALDLLRGDRPAFDLEEEYERSYPHDRLASHVIGFAGADLAGITGIERVLNDELLGTPARLRRVVDAYGKTVWSETDPPDRPHHDVALTLDLVLQHIVERELDRAVGETGAVAASAVLLDPRTGEILALANRPAPRLSDFRSASDDTQRNRATYDLYEPGSTFKTFSAAALIEAGRVRPDTRFDCERGSWRFHDRTARDHEPHGVLAFRDVFAESSNIGMVKATIGASGRRLRETYRRFGFGERTGIPLSERSGDFSDIENNEVDKAWVSFGYGVQVTALQLASAMGAIANGGVRVPPSLVLALRKADGDWVAAERAEPVEAISPETARIMTSLLERVVERGTGRNAAVPGYRVAGKTGTSKRHVEGVGYVAGRYWASFAGFAPSDAPRVALVVVLDSPRSSVYGGSTAAPVFSRVVADALAYLRVPPQGADVVVLPREAAHRERSARPASTAGGAR